jgi:hypothetical protein
LIIKLADSTLIKIGCKYILVYYYFTKNSTKKNAATHLN